VSRAPAGAPPIVTEGLTKHFGDVRAVRDLSIEVRRGEVFGLLGPNGAGKTTTLRMLMDFLRPTSGGARVLGATAADPDVRRRIGYLPSELPIDPRYTAEDWLDFCAALRGTDDRTRRAALLERFDLDPRRPSGELSTGNRRKIGVVAAFAHRPELAVLDEPTSGLDPLLQHEFQALVREAVHEGTTVLLSSHVLPEVERLADRVGMIRDGRLVAVSTIAQLQRRARSTIELHLARKPPPDAFDDIDGVVGVNVRGRVVRLTVQGSVNAALKAAARHDVRRIVAQEADLDEIFLTFYRDQPKQRDR
jgi:ABC-2 type transport system ATP-binding protein